MFTNDKVFETENKRKIWQRYCGFLDLSIAEFMQIQERLLLEQIDLTYSSLLGRKLMPKKPKSVSEFREVVPLTTYDDYAVYLNEKREDALTIKPYLWGHTSGRGGTFKWVPYTEGVIESFCTIATAAIIMSCTNRKGEVNVKSGNRLLQNLPPPPYTAGILAPIVAQRLDSYVIPPLDKYSDVDFQTRIQIGFKMALCTGVDTLSSLTSVLVKMGEHFTEKSGHMKFSFSMLHPKVMYRIIQALLISRREGRNLLPKDLWPLKGLICYGTDTSIYKEKLIYYWGKEPLELYSAAEAGMLATQAWNKKNLTFAPDSCFLEFVPEEEWLKSRENENYQPSTVLLDEVEPGKLYEIIITNFHGMPFLRYRLGDLIKVVDLEDVEAGIKLPQIAFQSRADGLIDISGFPRLDEKTIWNAIANSGVKYEDWSARKEYEQKDPVIRLYIELKQEMEAGELEKLVHQELVNLNRDYKDLEKMLGKRPLRVHLLPPGSFQRYYEKKQQSGADLAHLKPPHMNAPDIIIRDLIEIKRNQT